MIILNPPRPFIVNFPFNPLENLSCRSSDRLLDDDAIKRHKREEKCITPSLNCCASSFNGSKGAKYYFAITIITVNIQWESP